MLHLEFANPDLARALLPHAFDRTDGAHDLAHIRRVWGNVASIMADDGGDRDTLVAATILHDCVWIDKASPHRDKASRMAARRAGEVLTNLGWAPDRIDGVAHAIEAHSFSAGIPPRTQEARVLRDADRLDALGAIGIARCFWLAGSRGAALHDIADPAATDRALDDAAFAIDHFQTKLMTLEKGFLTPAGRRLATRRAATLKAFYRAFIEEAGGDARAPKG